MSEYDDPYDPNTKDLDNETPLLDELLKDTFDGLMMDIHTAIPAKIVMITPPNKFSVQPLLKRMYKDGIAVDLPVIQNCPVLMPRGADYYVKLPVKVDDTGLLIFSERSLDKWLISGGSVDPKDVRKFDLSDAIFIPGLYPFSAAIADTTTDLIVHNGNAEVRLKATGEVDVLAQTKVSLQRSLIATLSEKMVMGETTQMMLSTLLEKIIDLEVQLLTVMAAQAASATALAAHTHNIVLPVPSTPTGPPTSAATSVAEATALGIGITAITANEAVVTALKLHPVDDLAMLSDLSVTEK